MLHINGNVDKQRMYPILGTKATYTHFIKHKTTFSKTVPLSQTETHFYNTDRIYQTQAHFFQHKPT